MALPDFIHQSAKFLKNNGLPDNIEAAVILGSGLGNFRDCIQQSSSIGYSAIPHFPEPSVRGHDGKLIYGSVNRKNVIAFSGRFHHYEGFSFRQTALPVYIAKAVNARKLIISNAAGAINKNFNVGDLMVIDNVMRQNMCISPKNFSSFRYQHYKQSEKARVLAAELGLPVQRGTYLYAKGPNYETKAEIRAFRIMGADAVGMSTAPELSEAARLDIKAVAISLISNMAAGVTKTKLDHAEVKQTAELREKDFAKFVKKLISDL